MNKNLKTLKMQLKVESHSHSYPLLIILSYIVFNAQYHEIKPKNIFFRENNKNATKSRNS
jgi:hypothetical protein